MKTLGENGCLRTKEGQRPGTASEENSPGNMWVSDLQPPERARKKALLVKPPACGRLLGQPLRVTPAGKVSRSGAFPPGSAAWTFLASRQDAARSQRSCAQGGSLARPLGGGAHSMQGPAAKLGVHTRLPSRTTACCPSGIKYCQREKKQDKAKLK